MYGWIWRQLPGGTALRVLQTLLLVALVSTLLLLVVFPYLEPRLPASPLTGPVTVGQ
ncbi:MAG: hypothetical protein ABIQ09_02765 [Jatrophihabitantaceae bacterium]